LLVKSVNSALAPLQALFAERQNHPEELYGQRLQLGGALCTFALDSHPRDLPLYDHMHLDECFGRLDHHIRTHLETVAPTNSTIESNARVLVFIAFPCLLFFSRDSSGELSSDGIKNETRFKVNVT